MTTKSLRVLNLLSDPRVGGPQIRVAALGKAMRVLGIDTIVAVPEGPARRYFEEQDLPCLPFEFARLRVMHPVRSAANLIISLLPTASRLAALLHRERIDVLHCNGLMTVVGPLAARLAGVKLVWHMNDTQLPRPIYRSWLKMMRGFAHQVLFSSRGVAKYAGYGPDAQIMYPPVDIARFSRGRDPAQSAALSRELGLDPALPVVVCVGNVNRVKGHEFALEAVELLERGGTPVHLIIVGEAVDAAHELRLKRYVADRRLAGLVRFVGRTDEVLSYLHLATVFALPSLSEAMPIALLEAMAAGLPCVATDVAGVSEAIDDDVSGTLVPAQNGVALAGAISALLHDPEKRERLGRQARLKVARTFSVETLASAQARIYGSLFPDFLPDFAGSAMTVSPAE